MWTDPSGRCVFTGVDTIVCGAVAVTIYEAIALVVATGIAPYATYDVCVTQGACDRLAADLEQALDHDAAAHTTAGPRPAGAIRLCWSARTLPLH